MSDIIKADVIATQRLTKYYDRRPVGFIDALVMRLDLSAVAA